MKTFIFFQVKSSTHQVPMGIGYFVSTQYPWVLFIPNTHGYEKMPMGIGYGYGYHFSMGMGMGTQKIFRAHLY